MHIGNQASNKLNNKSICVNTNLKAENVNFVKLPVTFPASSAILVVIQYLIRVSRDLFVREILSECRNFFITILLHFTLVYCCVVC
jgi:hypothetical protein